MTDPLSLTNHGFCWATGIEDTFIPQVRPGMRRLDEYELTQHYDQWKTDFDLLSETGVQAVRWGIPWYRVQPKPTEWDWRWTDEALDYLVNVKGITPILDLMHYGTPTWLDNSFINAAYPARVAEYACAVARRYKSLVQYYTPFNEPMISAGSSGFNGVWPPYLVGRDGYVKVTLAVAKGIIETVRALKAEQPDAWTVQVEALWRLYTKDEDLLPRVRNHNERQFLSFDLTTGRMDEAHLLYPMLAENGATPADLEWFRQNAVGYDVFGANYYPWAYGPVGVRKKDGSLYRRPIRTSGLTLVDLIQGLYSRYQMPIMITETSALGSQHIRGQWMDETIASVRNLRQQGIPVVGYTWFPFFSMYSWQYRPGRQRLQDYLIHLGIYELAPDEDGVLQRRRTPLVDRYRFHTGQPMPPVAGGHPA